MLKFEIHESVEDFEDGQEAAGFPAVKQLNALLGLRMKAAKSGSASLIRIHSSELSEPGVFSD